MRKYTLRRTALVARVGALVRDGGGTTLDRVIAPAISLERAGPTVQWSTRGHHTTPGAPLVIAYHGGPSRSVVLVIDRREPR